MRKWDALIALRDFMARYTEGHDRVKAGEYAIEILYGYEVGFYTNLFTVEQENELNAICEALGLLLYKEEVFTSWAGRPNTIIRIRKRNEKQ